MKRVSILFLAVSILSTLSSESDAFDGNRKGLALGGGLGLGFVRYENESGKSQNVFSLMTDFKVGYGLGNQTAIWLTNKSAWFSRSGVIYAHTYGLAEVDYFFKSSARVFT